LTSAFPGTEISVVVPGVTLNACEKEMAVSLTVPVVAVLPDMKRKRVPPEPPQFTVQLDSKASQKSVPCDDGTVAAVAAGAFPAAVAIGTTSTPRSSATLSPTPKGLLLARLCVAGPGSAALAVLTPSTRTMTVEMRELMAR
jgi:hypothetical protein